MYNDFSKAVVGETLYSLRHGEVEVAAVSETSVIATLLKARYSNVAWFFDGRRFNSDVTPDLYWSKPEIIAPPAPPVTKEEEYTFWANIYDNGNAHGYDTLEKADANACPYRIGPAEKITIKRTVKVPRG